ncbi:MAG: sulfur carrier protein ThiS [Deltaproteobacteria bacterium]|nr:sulfur carrier protein ThiS [Deltaproteobacteria bacterium]
MQIRLNGQIRSIPEELSLAQLLAQLEVDPRHAAVAVNLEVVPHSEREIKKVHEGDEVEVFHAVGGG